ncbi:bifunctional phosphatase PAP2/diacylglycerol kinase family protein [Streptacidiphilus carbonis]|uniref:bifunctional phosphatase PAP2/diacylglycerol kinase family protein n=1 Tax=Streptacidiphilus carbonis TaxID=105422 RepID=UPI0005A77980|nr:bifunctional phosphatase PAP2/diacylglycerol kinase family protein [Streptacidiphilus carbonis]
MGRLHDLQKLDARLFDRVASARLRGAHPVLPRLGRAADHGALWMAAAAGLGLSRNRAARRAALRGVGSLALASTAANVFAKQVSGRSRPLTDVVPLARRLLRAPITTSFPSGHSASAAAFATAVTLESPWLGVVAVPLAAGVASSRVYTGAHYPGDVLAGVALGTGMALATLRWWPLRAGDAAKASPPRVRLPALPGGAGLVVVANQSSGTAGQALALLREALPQAQVRVCGPDQDLTALLVRAADEAARQGGALGVLGGDGSVNAAAPIALEHRLPLAVFPGGTLNHFAADLGILSPQHTAAAVEAGHGGSVDLGRVADRPAGAGAGPGYFLNTFSVGVYPELVAARRSLERRIGKWPALAVGLLRVLAEGRPTEAVVDGDRRSLWLLFVGNGRYDPPGFAPAYRRSLDDGLLDVRSVDGSHPYARTRLVAAFLTGTLARSRVYQASAVHRLRIDGLHRTEHQSRDGEIVPAGESVLLDKAGRALTLYLPA